MSESEFERRGPTSTGLRIAAAERIGRAIDLMAECHRVRESDDIDQVLRESWSRYLHKEAELNILLVIAVCLVKLAGDGRSMVVDDKGPEQETGGTL